MQNKKNFPKGEAPLKFVNYNGDYYMTQEEISELNEKVNTLISDFLDDKSERRENTVRYSAATVLVPLDDGKTSNSK